MGQNTMYELLQIYCQLAERATADAVIADETASVRRLLLVEALKILRPIQDLSVHERTVPLTREIL